jgi:hypothetical protein
LSRYTVCWREGCVEISQLLYVSAFMLRSV